MAVFRAVQRRRAGITSPEAAADYLRSTRLRWERGSWDTFDVASFCREIDALLLS